MSTLSKIGRITALVSFLIGTIILLTFLFDQIINPLSLAVIGMVYLYAVFAINLIIALVILSIAIFVKKNRRENFITFGLMCINIPIAIGYFFIAIGYF